MSGFLEYIVDPEAFFDRLRQRLTATRTIFSWAHLPAEPEERKRHGWISPLVIDPQPPSFFFGIFRASKDLLPRKGRRWQTLHEGFLA